MKISTLGAGRSVAALGASVVLIIAICFTAIVWMLDVSAASLDRTQKQGEVKLLRAVANDYKGFLAQSIADYTAWTELYQYLNGRPDRKWEAANLGPYITHAFAVDEVFIIARDGRLIYSYVHRRGAAQHVAPDMSTIRKLARLAFAAEAPDLQVPAAGYVKVAGMPSLAAASTIRDSAAAERSYFALVEIRVLSPQLLKSLGAAHSIEDLRAESATVNGVSLKGPDGRIAQFALKWSPSTAGHQLLVRVLPTVLAIAVLVVLALFGVVFVWYRIASRIKAEEDRLMEAELENSQLRADTAEEVSRSKSAFIANMSHELRTPLNAIIGFSELMRTEIFGSLGQKYREYIDDIHLSGSHLLQVVNDILLLSKLDADELSIDLQPVQLHGVLNEVVRIAGILAANKSIHMAVHLEDETTSVLADERALKQILLNLISNAIKFSAARSDIEVFSIESAADCAIHVRDTGCGIPSSTLAQIGRPFVQAEGAYSRKYQGTGLGLAISYSLARCMGAAITVESTEHVGTTATIVFKKASSFSSRLVSAA
jgi:signal transduction histidine kinase